MAHFKKTVKKKRDGKVVYGDKIVNGIVYLALAEIPYVELYSATTLNKTKRHSVNVFFDKDGVYIEVAVKVHYSQCVSDTAFKIQEAIRHNVETMVDYHVAGVDVIVKGILFGDLPAEKNNDEKNSDSTNGASDKQTEDSEALLNVDEAECEPSSEINA